MEVYVDDMLVKCLQNEDHGTDLREMLVLLRSTHEAKSNQMCLQSRIKKVPWLHGQQPRNKSQPI